MVRDDVWLKSYIASHVDLRVSDQHQTERPRNTVNRSKTLRMIKQTALEMLLYLGCGLIWLGPTLYTLLKRRMALLHPSFMVPAYMMFSISIALSEHWFGWSRRGISPGIRRETQVLQWVETLYTEPLAIMLVLGLVFHFGVWVACGRLLPDREDRIHLRLPQMRLSTRSRALLMTFCAVCTVCCCIPFLLFGQGSGFFWTVSLYTCIPLFPFLLSLYWPRAGKMLFFVGLAEMLILPSKENFFYYFFPYILFWQGTLFSGNFKAKLWRFLGVCCCAVGLYYGTYYLIDLRNERQERKSFLEYILVREYGFETFAVLTHAVPLSGSPNGGTSVVENFAELIPAALLPFDKPKGSRILASIMVRDYRASPNTGFYKFFCFDAYYDNGIVEAACYCFIFAFLLGKIYKIAIQRTMRLKTCWPLVCYLPWVMYAQFWVNGIIAFGILYSCGASALVYMIARSTISKRSYSVFSDSPRLVGRRVFGPQRAIQTEQ